ncbi:MAG: BREX-1 system phosphatase PglZ type A [Saprospiraceae bacterium]|nr:BREX-1 system phosphatase PglZ type A [Saprospiraceae bacterium]MBP6565697.1 BREX-1 system phosphatase PglZ type A [Saprospiraceae bacterium]
MIQEKIVQSFTNNPNKRCLFIFDQGQEYYEELAEMPEGYQLIYADGKYFDTKIKITQQLNDTSDRIVIYHPFSRPDDKSMSQYPLLGIMVSSLELRMDEVAHFMETYQLPGGARFLVQKWLSFLTKTNQKKLAKILNPDDFTENNLHKGLISIALDLNTVAEKEDILMKYLSLGTDIPKLNKCISRIEAMGLADIIYKWLKEIFDLPANTLDKSTIKKVIITTKYNMITYDSPTPNKYDTYRIFKIQHPSSLTRLHAFFTSWSEHTLYKKDIEVLFNALGADIEENKILDWYGYDYSFGYYTGNMVEMILQKHISQLTLHISKEKGSLGLKKYFADELILAAYPDLQVMATMLNLIVDLMARTADNKYYLISNPTDILTKYESEDYLIDTYYRKMILHHSALDEAGKLTVNELYTSIHEIYYKFLIRQNSHWQDKMNTISFDYSKISFPKQYDFAKTNLTEHKSAVIISDAFRFELAKELEQELLRDDKTKIELKGALASVPSYTQMGMSNLLPHNAIDVNLDNETFNLKINGIATSAPNREKILQQYKENTAARSFKEINAMSITEGRALFNQYKLVYIYHNHVDATSDKQELENYTFQACSNAITELKELVKKLYNWNVYYQYITADHGFLYNHKDMEDADKEEMPKTGKVFLADSRCCLTDNTTDHSTGYAFPLRNTTQLDTDLQVLIPKAINRFRRSGKIGLRFVHGGASLQELVVPVLKYYKKVDPVRKKVDFIRVDNNTKMTGSLKFSVLQSEPVSAETRPRTLFIGLYNIENQLISNEVKIIMDIQDPRPSARTFSEILSLTSLGSRSGFCYLRCFEEDDDQRINPIVINDKIIIQSLMETDEF